MQTDYFHRPCGTWAFTKEGPPYGPGMVIRSSEITLPDGTRPLAMHQLNCRGCPLPSGFGSKYFRIHVRRD